MMRGKYSSNVSSARALDGRGIKIPTMYKFGIGSFFRVLAEGCAIVTNCRIHYVTNGETRRGVMAGVLLLSMDWRDLRRVVGGP